jgi:hypothetical protein
MGSEPLSGAGHVVPALPSERQRWLIGLLAIVGGACAIAGTVLPWLSLFAGLQSYPGIAGLNGQLLFGAGVLSVIAGIAFLLRGGRRLRWGVGLLGFALLAFSSWLLLALLKTLDQLSPDPVMLARLGPGPVITVAGALLVFVTLFL